MKGDEGMKQSRKLAQLCLPLLLVLSSAVFAADLVSLAGKVTEQANAVAKLLSVLSYVAGVGFAMAGVLQLKAHKENPQQIPLSKPVVMLVVATCLLFLPSILDTAGASLFGEEGVSAAGAGGGAALGG